MLKSIGKVNKKQQCQLMMDRNENSWPKVKVCHRFEFPLFFRCRADEYANSVVGAKLYVSPEVYQKKYNSKRYAFG